MKHLLCIIGIHRPLIIEDACFIDQVTYKTVFHARCSCNKKWLTDSFNGWSGFKIERVMSKYFSKNTWDNERKR